MTHFLISEDNPDGLKLEDILAAIRKDILLRCTKIVDDKKAEAAQVLDNSLKILNLLTEAIHLAENSTQVLDKSFGPSKPGDGSPPRIGNP
ncbi:MAG: histidine kinase [Proteobacteria bacterium]|nr:histidine kinase [Pseudomonadota bacterium]